MSGCIRLRFHHQLLRVRAESASNFRFQLECEVTDARCLDYADFT
jgi:hypothetical protein